MRNGTKIRRTSKRSKMHRRMGETRMMMMGLRLENPGFILVCVRVLVPRNPWGSGNGFLEKIVLT